MKKLSLAMIILGALGTIIGGVNLMYAQRNFNQKQEQKFSNRAEPNTIYGGFSAGLMYASALSCLAGVYYSKERDNSRWQ